MPENRKEFTVSEADHKKLFELYNNWIGGPVAFLCGRGHSTIIREGEKEFKDFATSLALKYGWKAGTARFEHDKLIVLAQENSGAELG